MDHQCPVCGAALAEGSAMCSVCKAGLRWLDGKPSPALCGMGARPLWLLLLAVAALAVLLLIACGSPPRAWVEEPPPAPTAIAALTPRPDGLTPDQAATLASLRKVDDYPLYTMRYSRSSDLSRSWLSRQTRVWASPKARITGIEASAGLSGQQAQPAKASNPEEYHNIYTNPAWACSLFAALGDPANRLYGRNFDWRYSPALLLFTDRPAAGGYASVSMVDIAYLGFDDRAADLTTLPLAERRALLAAAEWPFDGMNEAGVAVGMAALPQADERHDPDKPAIGSLQVIREILDHAGATDEAVAILSRYNIDWEGGPPLHYLVADRSGRAALVEFHAGEIVVLPNAGPWHAATNFTRSAAAGDAAGQCWRYDTLVRQLTAAAGHLNSRDALGLLQTVAQTEAATQWSVVYGMSIGQVDVVMGRGYDRVHTFRLGQQ